MGGNVCLPKRLAGIVRETDLHDLLATIISHINSLNKIKFIIIYFVSELTWLDSSILILEMSL